MIGGRELQEHQATVHPKNVTSIRSINRNHRVLGGVQLAVRAGVGPNLIVKHQAADQFCGIC